MEFKELKTVIIIEIRLRLFNNDIIEYGSFLCLARFNFTLYSSYLFLVGLIFKSNISITSKSAVYIEPSLKFPLTPILIFS